MSDLIDTTEMYLRTIYELEEEGITPLRARIAERLGHSGPTVSQTVARMERDGLLSIDADRHLELTDLGRSKATRVMRKHRLAERLLVDVIGLEWQYVHEEACRWEHVMSDRVERKLLELLPDARESPYGNPVPGLAELAGPDWHSEGFRTGVHSLVEALDGDRAGAPLIVRRLGEPLQTDPERLAEFARVGLLPGARIAARREGAVVRIEVGAGLLDLSPADASHVFIADAAAVAVGEQSVE